MDSEKSWNRPWSTQEIIENSENWSLAGDVALLNTIKQFANNLLTKTDELNNNINNLLNNLDEVGLKLDISQNEFQSLKNTQFIESRVYDDDETLDSKEHEKISENSTQKEEEQRIDINLTSELQLLDKYYEMVEISISDSEDESEKSFVLKPKDMYEERRLPPLIGSEEWYKNWYLEDEASDVDSQNSEEVYSDSDSDDNLPKDLMYMSETSSELDFSQHANENRPHANSTLKDEAIKPESITSSEGSEDPHYVPTKAPLSNKIFAEQLAAKLDNVISREENVPEVINSKPIQPTRTDTFSAGLFSDEPPPLSDSEDKTLKGIFSGSKNLFDEDEDEDSLLWDNQKKMSLPQNKQEDNKNEIHRDIKADVAKSATRSAFLPESSQVSKGLFDSDNSDDDIFAAKSQIKKNTFLQPHKPIVPLIDDEPPAIGGQNEAEQPVKKKPVGGVSMFGNQNIGELLKKRQENNANSEKFTSQNILDTKPKEDAPQKKLNLFNDNDLFTKIDTKTKPKKCNLFDDDKNIKNETISSTEVPRKKTKILSLFDDDEESENDDDIFSVPKKSTDVVKNVQNKKSDLFSDKLFEESFNKKNDLKAANKTYGSNLFGEEKEERAFKEESLFAEKIITENDVSLFEENETKSEEREKLDNQKEDKEEETSEKSLVEFKEDGEVVLLNKKDEDYVKKSVLFEDNVESSTTAVSLFGDEKKSKKIGLFDDYDDDDEDLFSNVTKKNDFKLFEEPETTDDLFSIKKEVKKENLIKTAQIERTDDYIKVNSNKSIEYSDKLSKGVKEVVGNSQNDTKEECSESEKDFSRSLMHTMDNKNVEKILDDQTSSKFVESGEVPNPASLFDDGLLTNNQTFDNKKDDLVDDKTTTTPPKPPVAEKPRSLPPTIQSQTVETTPPTAVSVSKEAPSGKPVVNLLSSTPPPDDDDWDNKSDTFSDTEDFLAYRVDQSSNRSNLFDNEPPSLNGDESSGIVRDYRNTRIETDDSSFCPDASSSRRLSSDIFSEQQSQDSFFVTKNRPDSTNPSQLDSIPEDSKMTTIDVTPSGKLEETSTTNQSIRNNLSESLLSDDIFSKTKLDHESDSEPPVSERIQNVDNSDVSVTQNAEKSERSIRKIASITEMLKNQGQKESTENKVSPGKLKENLSINVNALLPGYSQHKIKSLTKTQSLDLPVDENRNEKADNGGFGSSKASSYKDLSRVDSEKPLEFDEPDHANVLHSITKERVRIPVKRRPSTRRGRQEALRKSVNLIPDDILSGSGDFEGPQQQKIVAEPSEANKSPENTPAIATANMESAIPVKKNSEDLPKNISKLASLQLHSEILGRVQESQKPESEKKISSNKQNAKVSLFGSGSDSNNDDDDLFGNLGQKKKKTKENPKVKNLKAISKKSLFDDNSSDDDLFAGSTSSKSRKKTEPVTKVIEKKVKPTIKKLENVETIEDPLSNLLK